MATQAQSSPPRHGVTLIELLVVLVIVGLISAVAWPTYQNAVNRSRRADGMSALTELVQAQERWRATFPSYKDSLTSPPLPGARTVSKDGHYDLSLENVTATTYTARATVHSGSPQTTDTACQVLMVSVTRGNIVYTSVASSGTTNSSPDPCWAK